MSENTSYASRQQDARRSLFHETYEILERLGSGKSGTVYKAYHKNLDKYVVLKRINDDVSDTINTRAERDALKNLRHPYIPQVLDFIELDENIYTVMDFVPGKTFAKLLEEGRQFTQSEVLKYAIQLFETLEYIHSRTPQIIHGDIKPANLMLTPDDNICLIDFNIAGIVDHKQGVVIEGYTRGYAAPEQIREFTKLQKQLDAGDGDDYQKTELLQAPYKKEEPIGLNKASAEADIVGKVDCRADIYSAAATLYHILTGKIPLPVRGIVPEARSVDPKVSEGMNYILTKALQADPDGRFQSASEVLTALHNIHKFEKRFKDLVRRQNLRKACAILCILAGIVLVSVGRNLISQEKRNSYEEYISEMREICIRTGNGSAAEDDFQRIDELLSMSTALYPNEPTAFIQKAEFLYLNRQFEEAIDFIETELTSKQNFSGRGEMAEAYRILGNSCFYIDPPDYSRAAGAFQKSIDLDQSIVDNYRDLAISLAKAGREEEAQITLDEAVDRGLTDDNLYLVRGELSLALEDYEAAKTNFRSCIHETDNSEVKMRAYVGMHEAIVGAGKTENALKEASAEMERALTELDQTMQLQILQYEAQDYLDLLNLTGDKEYARKGISVLEKLDDNGRANYTTHLNIAFLYEQIGEYDTSLQILLSLLEGDSSNYNTYKRLAFLEADIQNGREISQRDYKAFADYYRQAKELYAQQMNQNDLEMQLLDSMYNEAVSGGWINSQEAGE